MRCRLWSVLLFSCVPWLGGCAGLYAKPAGEPTPVVQYSLDRWPYEGYWTGVVFNGVKVGFTHLAIAADPGEPETYAIRSEAALRLRFLTIDKKVNLVAEDHVDAALRLRRFSYRYDLDGNVMEIAGRVDGERLTTEVVTRGGRESRTYNVPGGIYPSSAFALYPLLHGLAVGRRYEYPVYEGETQRVGTVIQEVRAWEKSELFEGSAFRVETLMYGNKTDTWLNAMGLPVLEMAMNGVLISGLESEEGARRSLALAALNKQEALLDFSLVKSDAPIASPAQTTMLKLSLEGLGPAFALPDDRLQRCRWDGEAAICTIERARLESGEPEKPGQEDYLRPSATVTSRHPAISRLGQQITEHASSRAEKIEALVAWMRSNIQQEAVDAFSAMDVLETRKAECQGHSYLYAALARSVGIPTRVVNGLVYSKPHGGFLYHTWTESWVGGRWLPVDPTFGQVGADATHVKLIEGESLADLVPLADLVGRLRVRVLSVESEAQRGEHQPAL
jgi:Transglutaminase-like superfamily